MGCEGKFWTKDTERPKSPRATSEELGAHAGYCTGSLHITPAKRWTERLRHPSKPAPWAHPALCAYKETACSPQQANKQGTCCFFSFPWSWVPSKPSEFPVWPLINFYWLRRPRTLVSNNTWSKARSTFSPTKPKFSLPTKMTHAITSLIPPTQEILQVLTN